MQNIFIQMEQNESRIMANCINQCCPVVIGIFFCKNITILIGQFATAITDFVTENIVKSSTFLFT